MSGSRSFLDSNVVAYLDDNLRPDKQERALVLLDGLRQRDDGVVSIQVLQEYFVTATRKLGMEAATARERVALLGELHVVRPRVDDVLAAIDLHRLHHISFWDALIVRSALVSGCARLYSEDLQHGRRFDSVEVVNPFL